MPTFQVSSRSAHFPVPLKKRTRRIPYQREIVTRVVAGLLFTAFVLTLLATLNNKIVFFFVPVYASLLMAQPQRYNLVKFIASTPLYLLLTVCLTIMYYSILTEGVLFIQTRGPSVSYILLVTNAVAWAIMFDPVRAYIQSLIERRFNVQDRELRKAIEEFTATLREEIDLTQLRDRFLTVIEQTMQPYSVSLWIRSSKKQHEPSRSADEMVMSDDDPLLAYMLNYPGIVKIDRLRLDSPILQDLRLHGVELLLPLTSQGDLLGLLVLGSHLKGEEYTREECTMLNTLAPQVAPALRVAQMVQEQQVQVREHERIEQELRTAQAIQQTFLPKDVPAPAGWKLVPYYRPAYEVGGDFYDFFLFDDGRLGIIVGDVTDKGVPAALVMATTHTMLRSAMQTISAPGKVLAQVNDLLCTSIPSRMFVTCFYALLDPTSGQLRYANAGHEPPYRRYNGNAAELWATGMPLGLMPGMYYEEHEATLSPGESLLFYSDGLVEAHNPDREMFGFPRLQKFLVEQIDESSLIDALLSELKRFTGEGWEQEDDVTLVTLQRT